MKQQEQIPQTPIASLLMDMELLEVQTNYDFQECWRTLKERSMLILGMLQQEEPAKQEPPKQEAEKPKED